jgi:hypothetical protein
MWASALPESSSLQVPWPLLRRAFEPVPVVFRFAPDVYFFGGYFLAGEVGE